MPAVMTRADALREYLTGAIADGGAQANQALSLGNYRSSTEVASYGVTLANAINNLIIDYASGGCAEGDGILTCVSPNSISWRDSNSSAPGPNLTLALNGDRGIVEAPDAGSYLRVTRGSGVLSGGPCTVTLNPLVDNVAAMDDVTSAQALAGESTFRGTILRNEGTITVGNIQRFISVLGTLQISNVTQLSGSGAGTIQTTGSFADWPATGWVQIRTTGIGTLREIAYYSSRTDKILTIPAGGRGLLGTAASVGAVSDQLYPVPGIAIALDVGGIQNNGQPMVNIGTQVTVPPGVLWNRGITPTSGLAIGSLAVGKEIGLWIWRHIPPGAYASPGLLTKIVTTFQAA